MFCQGCSEYQSFTAKWGQHRCPFVENPVKSKVCKQALKAYQCQICFRRQMFSDRVWNFPGCPLKQFNERFRQLVATCTLLNPQSFVNTRVNVTGLLTAMRKHGVKPTLARRVERTKWQLWSLRLLRRPEEGRLHPLPEEKYNEWAHQVWINRGRPKLGKRKVNGATFGGGKLVTNEKCGWDRVIYRRHLGVQIVRKPDGRAGIEIVCPDGKPSRRD